MNHVVYVSSRLKPAISSNELLICSNESKQHYAEQQIKNSISYMTLFIQYFFKFKTLKFRPEWSGIRAKVSVGISIPCYKKMILRNGVVAVMLPCDLRAFGIKLERFWEHYKEGPQNGLQYMGVRAQETRERTEMSPGMWDSGAFWWGQHWLQDPRQCMLCFGRKLVWALLLFKILWMREREK